MLIEDAEKFTLVIPTFEGTPYLRRCLDYLRHLGYAGHIVLSDNSSGAHREFVERTPQEYPELWLDVDVHPPTIRFLDKLCATLEKLQARCVMLCGQDDFVVPAAIERIVQRLDADPGLSAARGRVARFSLQRPPPEAPARKVGMALQRHPMRAYPQPDPVERVLAHLHAYSPLFYSVHRRTLLLECFRRTEQATRSVIFFQYLSSCITVFQGRVDSLDELFLLRQAHADSWSGKLQDDYEHWPLLVTSPQFSRHYAQFRDALLALLANGASARAGLGPRLDRACVDLIRRGLCMIGPEDARDEEFFTLLGTPDSAPRSLLEAVVNFTLAYPETY